MNNIYIHSKEDNKRIVSVILLALLPLLITGFYKNGVKLYLNGLVSFNEMLKPLIIDLLGYSIGIIVAIISNYKNKVNQKGNVFNSLYPLYGLLTASVISINTNILVFSGITLIVLLIFSIFKRTYINIISLSSLIIIFVTKLLGSFSYLNIYETKNVLSLNTLDYLFGRGSGGINTTHIMALAISLILLCSLKSYKREIPLYSIISYSTCMIIYCIITNNIGLILDNIFTNSILFSFVFIAAEPLSSSYTPKGKIIYSILIGISTFGLYLLYPSLAALGGILIASICHTTIDKLCLRK